MRGSNAISDLNRVAAAHSGAWDETVLIKSAYDPTIIYKDFIHLKPESR